jgi:Ca2+/H+ antiporter, TMEM165/GDT1 family
MPVTFADLALPSITLGHVWPTVAAAFLASLVEFVEALTVILAVGAVRGWRGAIAGAAAGVLFLLLLVLALGPALTRIPLRSVQFGVGFLLTLFGMRWLRKAILRAAGWLPLHDEERIYANQTAALRGLAGAEGAFDWVGSAATFKITALEGLEVVFIVIAVGAGGAGLLVPASLGAFAALVIVAALGLALHRPLAAIPENALKFAVGVLLSAFGTFWVGEGAGLRWPGGDMALAGLVAGFVAAALSAVFWLRRRSDGFAAAHAPETGQ